MTAPVDLSYYETLNVKAEAGDAELRAAYRRLALKWHPDKHDARTKQVAEENFIAIAEAFSVLSDRSKRARFDQYGKKGLKSNNPNAGDKPIPGWSFEVNPKQVFEEFFGNVNPFAEFSNGDAMFTEVKDAAIEKAPAIEANLYVSLEELYTGAVKKQKVIRQRIADDGKGTVSEEKILTVEISAGWKAGTKLTFPSQGDHSLTLAPGDVVFTVKEKPHPRFKRDKNDLIFTAKISLLEALVGTKIDILMLDGRTVPVAINEIVNPTFTKVLKGEGMPLSKKQTSKGDVKIVFDVVYPSMLSISQKEEITKLLPPL
jgi:DnaJ-class molecular chaperone